MIQMVILVCLSRWMEKHTTSPKRNDWANNNRVQNHYNFNELENLCKKSIKTVIFLLKFEFDYNQLFD